MTFAPLRLMPKPERVPSSKATSSPATAIPAAAAEPTDTAITTTPDRKLFARTPRTMKKCTIPDCESLARSRGRCKAHGGGKRCNELGCELSDQGGGFCIRHGGGRRCEVDGCVKSAQSRHFCKAHGGGVRCSVDGCAKPSQGGGCCRAHGGGPRFKKNGKNSITDGEVAAPAASLSPTTQQSPVSKPYEPHVAANDTWKTVKRRLATTTASAPSMSESEEVSARSYRSQSQMKSSLTFRIHPISTSDRVSAPREPVLKTPNEAWCRIDGCGNAVPIASNASQLCEEHGTNLYFAASLLGMLSTESA